jgi:hypothetical protein
MENTDGNTGDITSSTIPPASFNTLPAEVILQIVDHLCNLPPEPDDLTSQHQISCPCTHESNDPKAPLSIFPYGKLRKNQDPRAPLLMVNHRTRDILFEERYKSGLKLAFCEDVMEETRRMSIDLRSTVQ